MTEKSEAAPLPPPDAPDLSFEGLRSANLARLAASWPTEDPWAPWDWSNALVGEVGEACVEGLALMTALSARAGAVSNLTKKMNRVWPSGQFATAWNKPEDQRIDELAGRLADELADVVIYADLLASKLGKSLGECVRAKFNAKSEEIGSTVRLAASGAPPAPHEQPDGVSLIALERQRQQSVEGWTSQHDDSYDDGQMLSAAIVYAERVRLSDSFASTLPPFWPWSASWWQPSPDPIRNLVKAGALIAAEIDRIQRLASDPPDPKETL